MEVFTVEVSPALVLRTVDGRAEYRVEGQRVFGRADFSWHPRSVFISRRHFAVEYLEGTYFVEDLGSTNGTFLNGVDIRGRGKTPLRLGDVINVAGVLELVVAYK